MITPLTNEELTNILVEQKFTIKQFYFLWLLSTEEDSRLLGRYCSNVKNPNKFQFKNLSEGTINDRDAPTIEECQDLENRGFIKPYIKGKVTSFLDYEVTSSYLNELWIKTSVAGKEFIDLYPNNLYINGVEIPSKATDLDKLAVDYCRAIGNSRKKHKEIMELLKEYFTSNTYANMKIENFVKSKHWERLPTTSNQSYKML